MKKNWAVPYTSKLIWNYALRQMVCSCTYHIYLMKMEMVNVVLAPFFRVRIPFSSWHNTLVATAAAEALFYQTLLLKSTISRHVPHCFDVATFLFFLFSTRSHSNSDFVVRLLLSIIYFFCVMALFNCSVAFLCWIRRAIHSQWTKHIQAVCISIDTW